jgi:uncharacterized membrane protein
MSANDTSRWNEKNTHRLFQWSIILKSIDAGIQLIGGIIILYIPLQPVVDFISSISLDELAENPTNFLASSALSWSQSLSMDVKIFAAWYLISHGVVKTILLIGLIKEYLWAFPASLAIFTGFFFYQVYLLTFKTHSPWLVALTIFNVIFIFLVYHEYRIRKQLLLKKASHS